MSENPRSSIVSRGYKIRTLRRSGWNKLVMLIFKQFKNSLFQGATFTNCLGIFKWIARESLLHRVHGVHRKDGIGVQINNRQTQVFETTLIHCYFSVATLKQR